MAKGRFMDLIIDSCFLKSKRENQRGLWRKKGIL